MGMRATFARITKTGKVVCTSSQWATQTDHTLGSYLSSIKAEKRPAAMKRLFTEITKNEHMSALERNERAGGKPVVFGAQNSGDDDFRKVTGSRLKADKVTPLDFFANYHIDSGLSVAFIETEPEKLTFAWYNDDDLVFQTLTLDELANGVATHYHTVY